MRKFIYIIFLICQSSLLLSQTDTEFWFAVPYATDLHDGPVGAKLRLTSAGNASTVIVSQPYNPQFAPIVVNLLPNQTQTVDFDNTQYDLISGYAYDVKANYALHIESTDDITAYFELTQYNGSFQNYNNPDIFSLKGSNAIGYEFYTPFQTTWNNHNYNNNTQPDCSGIDIVATEDSTEIEIYLRKPAAKLGGGDHIAGSTISIILNKGQTYHLVPSFNGGTRPSHLTTSRLVGTHIKSNKPIAVTIKDDSVQKSGAYDYIGDQLIPIKNIKNKAVIGHEYLVMKGKVDSNNERFYILTTEDGTNITVDGIPVGVPINKGIQLSYNINNGTNFRHILADKPIYILHVSGVTHEMGGAVLPTIDGCSGSLSVSFMRSKGGTDKLYLNLMTKDYAVDSFKVEIDGVLTPGLISSSMFEQAGSSGWYVLKDIEKEFSDAEIPANRVIRVYNTAAVFHLGMLNGRSSGGGNMYGYFTDFDQLEAEAFSVETGTPLVQLCGVDTVQLKAKGGLNYFWSPTEYVDDPTAQNPKVFPPKGGITTFTVKILHPCHGDTSAYVSVLLPEEPFSFAAISKNKGCAPLEVDFTNGSSGALDYVHDYGDGSPHHVTANYNDINQSIVYNNTSDTLTYYVSRLSVANIYGCTSVHYDTIWVYPQVNSSFEVEAGYDTIGCHPLDVGFYSTSTGNTDKYKWDYGDGVYATDSSVLHTFTNTGSDDSTYTVELIAISPFLCQDTTTREVTVHPNIEAHFASDPAVSCSPLSLSLDPKNSIGVDTFRWHIYDNPSTFDSLYITDSYNIIPLSHNDVTQISPDTIFIGLIVANEEGCYDTVQDRKIIVYPEVNSAFTTSASDVCDSVPINFANNSAGFNLSYFWDFDDGTSSTSHSLDHTYYNRGDADSIFNVSLIARSSFLCSDTSSMQITVHPYVKSQFTVDHQNNCSPLQTNIYNSSIAPTGSTFKWNFGDGDSISQPIQSNHTHTFTNPLANKDTVYKINLTITTAQNCVSMLERELLVYSKVEPQFVFDKYMGCQPLEVSVTNQSTGGSLKYDWIFGDNTSSSTSLLNFTKEFENHSSKDTTYHVTLTATNPNGCSHSIQKDVDVYAFINANFNLANPDSCSPFPLDIDNQSQGGIANFFWDFDDSSPIDNNFEPNHIYSNTTDAIIYRDLELIVKNNHACYDTLIKQVTVYPEAVADFVTNDAVYENCQPFLVDFINNSNIPATNFEWNFGDGYDSGKKIPDPHTFNNKTNNDVTYPVTLIATSDYGCRDEITKDIITYAYIESNFTLTNSDSCSPFPLDIRNTSKGGIDVYNWEFDDGAAQSNLFEPAHTYTNATDNIINRDLRLVVKNAHACYDTLIKPVTVYPEVVADFATNDGIYENCQPFDVQFVNNSNIPATQFKWDFGDAGGSVLSNPDLHRFTNAGTVDSTYTVTLTSISDYGCRDAISKDIITYAYIESKFATENTDSCSPFPLRINNLSPGGVDEFFWNFGDGSPISSQENPNHTYTNKTSSVLYPTLELVVKNQHACYDTFQQQITVYPEVVANFTTSNGLFEACQPFDVEFVNTSNGPAEYFIWTFDDGTYDILDDPSKMFENYEATDQVYHVNLYAESDYQCIDDTTIDLIAYSYTEAAFTTDDDDVCYGYPIEIRNESSPGSVQFDWDLGNGVNRNDATGFTYTWLNETEGRTYDLSLTARNSHGCSHTKIQPIQIFPQVRARIALSDSSNCHPLNAKFFNISENVDSNDKFYWDFGNNSGTSNSFEPYDREFVNEGLADKNYDIILRAEERDNGCFGYDTLPITVHAIPQSSFELVSGKTKGCPNFPVDIQNTTNPVQDYANTYIYLFDDNSSPYVTLNKNNVTHEYDNVTSVNQNFDLTLVTTSSMGCRDSAFKTLTVHPRVTANFESMGPTEACSPYILEFEDRSINEHVYEWSFGDGSISSDEFPSNRYVNESDSIRTFNVLLRAVSDYQCWDTASTVVTIYPSPTAMFYATPHTQFYPSSTVEIENKTKLADIWNYDWDFDDNTTHQTSYNPVPHNYGYWGDYNIKMKVWNDYCMDSLARTITVYPALPIARFDSSVQGCVPLTVTFEDNSIYGKKHTWDFDDGETITSGPGNDEEAQLNIWGEEVSHTFTKPGLYNVVLTVEGDGGIDQTNNIVEVYPKPDVSFEIAPTTVMLPDEKIQTFNSTVAKPDFQWLWNFGDGEMSTSKEPDHLYTELGKYDISLTVWTENMCVDSLVLEQIVSVEGTGIMEFPNAFVPSLNGPSGGSYSINQPTTSVFHPYHDGVVDYKLEIYTRWGELIYVSEDVQIGWDGYINGSLAKQDVYVWRVKGTYTNGNPFVKVGDVTLVVSPNQYE